MKTKAKVDAMSGTTSILGVIYVRVSTDEQAEKGLSIPAQIQACEKYAKDRGILIARTFRDEGESAKTSDRPGFQEMIAYVKASKEAKAVIVYDTSRFARNRYDAALYKRELEKTQVRVHYAAQPIEDTVEGRFLEGMLEVIDEHYSRALARVVKRGMKEAASRGNWLGAPPWGYNLTRENGRRTLELDPRTSRGVELIFQWFSQGLGCRAIAERLTESGYTTRRGKPFSPEMVRQVLRNPAYAGDTVFNRRCAGRRIAHPQEEWVIVKDTHPAIVTREQFLAVGKEMTRRGLNRRPGEHKTYRRFSGLVSCARCGKAACAQTGTSKNGNAYYYYVCRTRTQRAKKLCEGFRVRADLLEERLIGLINEQVFSDESIAEFIGYVRHRLHEMDQGRSSEKIRIRRRLEAVQGRLRKVVLALEEDLIDGQEAKRRTAELQEEREALLERLARADDAEAIKSIVPTKAILEAARREFRTLLEQADARTQRTFFQRFIRGIRVDGSTAEVAYNLGYLGAQNGVLNSIRVSGPEEIRTPDLLVANEALSQLSYWPVP